MDKKPETSKKLKVRSSVKPEVKLEFIAEWRLFWAGLLGEETEAEKREEKLVSKVHELTQPKIKTLIKTLSQDRLGLNRELERIIEESDELSSKIEALKLVKGDYSEIETQLASLNEQGEQLTLQLEVLDKKLKIIRQRENDLNQARKLLKNSEA